MALPILEVLVSSRPPCLGVPSGQDRWPEGHRYLQQWFLKTLGVWNIVSVIPLLTTYQEMQGEGSGLQFTIPGGWRGWDACRGRLWGLRNLTHPWGLFPIR